jgi:hypothetical protein
MNQANPIDIGKIIAPYLEGMGEPPSYGTFGVDLVFHDGRITKIEEHRSITLKPEPPELPEAVGK